MANMESMMFQVDCTFRKYGADRGLEENAQQIIRWRDAGVITKDEYKELRKYNRETYADLPLDW